MLVLIMPVETVLPNKNHVAHITRAEIRVDRLLQSRITEVDAQDISILRSEKTRIDKVPFLIGMCAEMPNDI